MKIENITNLGKIKRTYKNRRGSRRIFIFNNYDGHLILSQFACLKQSGFRRILTTEF